MNQTKHLRDKLEIPSCRECAKTSLLCLLLVQMINIGLLLPLIAIFFAVRLSGNSPSCQCVLSVNMNTLVASLFRPGA